jgi:hypothetical protein
MLHAIICPQVKDEAELVANIPRHFEEQAEPIEPIVDVPRICYLC